MVDTMIYFGAGLGLMTWLLVLLFTKCCNHKRESSIHSKCTVFSLMIRSTIILALIEILAETHVCETCGICLRVVF